MKTYTQLINEISPQVAARAYGARSMRTKVNPSEHGRQKEMDAYRRYTKRRQGAGLTPDELWPDYKSGESKELLKTPDYRIDKLKSQDALILRTRKKLERLKNEGTLGEGSLGHKRMLRLAKSGNLSPERLKSYILKGNQKSKVHWDRHDKMLDKIKKEWPDDWESHPTTGVPEHPDQTPKHKDLAQEHPNNANQIVKVYNANRHKHKSLNKYSGTARSYDDADARKHGIGSSKERPKLVHDRGMDANWNKRTGWHGYRYPQLDKVVHEPVK